MIATPERGMLMGNRGCLHNSRQEIQRPFRGQAWIICVLEFKGRRFPLMGSGHYTALFFLDEATALAAGQRPCAECQRPRFNLFWDTWARANPKLVSGPRLSAAELDQALHRERLSDPAMHPRSHTLDGLPDGVLEPVFVGRHPPNNPAGNQGGACGRAARSTLVSEVSPRRSAKVTG